MVELIRTASAISCSEEARAYLVANNDKHPSIKAKNYLYTKISIHIFRPLTNPGEWYTYSVASKAGGNIYIYETSWIQTLSFDNGSFRSPAMEGPSLPNPGYYSASEPEPEAWANGAATPKQLC